MILSIFILIIGLLILGYSANSFIGSSVKIARTLKVSEMMIGLTIVAIGTSAPELAVSAISALEGNGDLSIGNVIGSNIFNLGFILGLSAIIVPIVINKKMVYRDGTFLIFVILLVLFMLLDQKVGNIEGMILLGLLAGYNIFLWIKKEETEHEEVEENINLKTFILLFIGLVIGLAFHTETKGTGSNAQFLANLGFGTIGIILITVIFIGFIISLLLKDIPSINKDSKGNIYNIVLLFTSLALLVISSEQVVSSAVFIATYFGLSQWAIGATIIAAGTSLPEIAATVSAISKKKYDLGVGNVIGSDIFNILGIIGISSVLAPIELKGKCLFNQECSSGFSILFIDNLFSVFVLIITLMITLIFMRIGWKLSKAEGIFLFIFAICRMAFEINPNFFTG